MSQEWLNIQSFFTDHELIRAINDLSIFLKQEAAGVRDAERARLADEGRAALREFLQRLEHVEAAESKEPLLGIDARFQSLTDAIATAREESGAFRSILMRDGASAVLPLLDAQSQPDRQELLEALADLRRVVEHHQQEDASVIFEEQ